MFYNLITTPADHMILQVLKQHTLARKKRWWKLARGSTISKNFTNPILKQQVLAMKKTDGGSWLRGSTISENFTNPILKQKDGGSWLRGITISENFTNPTLKQQVLAMEKGWCKLASRKHKIGKLHKFHTEAASIGHERGMVEAAFEETQYRKTSQIQL